MKSKITYCLLFFTVSLTLFSFTELQVKQGPHNGQLEKAGNSYFIEFKNINQEIHTYLLDKNFKCIPNRDISCEIKFIYSDSISYTKPLQPFGSDGFSSGIFSTPFHSCRVIFNIYGKTVSAKFQNQNPLVQKRN